MAKILTCPIAVTLQKDRICLDAAKVLTCPIALTPQEDRISFDAAKLLTCAISETLQEEGFLLMRLNYLPALLQKHSKKKDFS